MNKTAVIVGGMHRSGTSALARAISLLGYALPADLMLPQEDNPKGFWEPQGFVRLNNRILQDLGAAWDRPGPFAMAGLSRADGQRRVMDIVRRDWLGRATAAVAASFSGADRIVIKDPRLSLFWPLWADALEQSGYQARHVLIYRNPLEVTESLRRRNDIGIPKALRLWALYNLATLRHAATGDLAAVVSFEGLLERPAATMAMLLGPIGYGQQPMTPDQAAAIEAYVTTEDRHHRSGDRDLATFWLVPDIVRELWQLLEGWAALEPERRLSAIESISARCEDALLLGGHTVPVRANLRFPDQQAAGLRSPSP